MIGAALLGLLLGLQHALEADHVAAVASIVSGQTAPRKIVMQGMAWGIGHAATLSLATLCVLALGHGLEENPAQWLEFGVGTMLIGLGLQVFWRLSQEGLHLHSHRRPRSPPHFHLHSHAEECVSHDASPHLHGHNRFPLRALAVGTMHGLAGSAALLLLTAVSSGNYASTIASSVVFGLGSIAGMAMLSAVIAIPLFWSAKLLTWGNTALQLIIATMTVGIGSKLAFTTKLHFLFGV